MITLHESNITQFPEDNGIGVLDDAISAYAEEELNGLFEFEMEYDSEGSLVDELKEERIIKAYAQDKLDYQLFRIYSITKNHENDNLIVNAQHITYDLAHNFVEELKANNLTKKQVMEKIGSEAVNPHSFNITSSNNSTQSSTELYRTNPLQMVAGMDGSVLQIWGGQIERDNFNLIMHDRRGHDDGVTVTYEKNITGLNAEIDISDLVTVIFPFVLIEATEDEPERLITITGKYHFSENYQKHSDLYIQPVDYSSDDRIDIQDKTDAQIRTQLTSVASQYFSETNNDKPKATLEVSFEHLWETEEYKGVAPLELVGMGDNVSINHSKLDVEATAIVNYIRYDCIALVNEEVKLGSVKARFSDSINKIDRIEKEVEDAKNDANQAIVSANGKNTTYYGPDEPTGDIKKGDLWFELIDGQYTRTYRFDGIEWKLIIDMESQEAKQEAEDARNRADEAYDNANIATQNASDALQEAIANATDIEDFAYTITGDESITTLAGTAGVLQSTLSDIDGNVNQLTQTVDATVSRIENMSGNLITHDVNNWTTGYWSSVVGGNGTTNNPIYIRTNERYPIKSGTYSLTSYGNYNVLMSLYDEDGYVRRESAENSNTTIEIGEDIIEFAIHLRYSDSGDISVNQIGTDIKVQLEKGEYSTGWTNYDGDVYSQYSQLSNAINLRVEKDDIINQINISEESILISGKKLILDGDTTINGDFKLDGSAHIKDASIGTAQIGTIDAAVASIINLSANNIRGGILTSQNSNTTFNLNSGKLHMENTDFELGGGANIEFSSSGNRIHYKRYDDSDGFNRSSGFGVGNGYNNRFPYVFMGTTGSGSLDPTDSNYFTGFIANTNKRMATDGIGNSAVGDIFHVRNNAVNFNQGWEFNLRSGRKEFKPINAGSYNYDLGTSNNYFDRVYAQEANVNAGNYTIINTHERTQAFRMMTGYQGESYLAFYGLNAGTGWNNNRYYALGKRTNRFSQIFLLNEPNVNSDKRLKENITNNTLGLDFINDLDTVTYNLIDDPIKPTNYGVLAQDVEVVLQNHGVDTSNVSLVEKDENGYYSMQPSQLVFPTIKAVQELDSKMSEAKEDLILKIAKLEQRISELESAV